MHPHTFYSTLFEIDKREEVFVIMSFAAEFNARWQDIIEPTIAALGLKANRVDYSLSGESIVHDIIDGIAHAKLVIADITSTRMRDSSDTIWPQRNGNVMWELGIAHTMRLPDEVILVKSDSDGSIFDLTQFRAFPYDPLDITAARQLLRSLSEDRLNSIDQIKHRMVVEASQSLDVDTLGFIRNRGSTSYFHYREPPMVNNIRQPDDGSRDAINRLLSLRMLRTETGYDGQTLVYAYHWTEFGKAVVRKLNISTP